MTESMEHVWINASSGEKIRQLRNDKGISQYELAERVNASLQQIDGYERGDKNMPVERLFNIAEVLGATPADLLSDE